MPMHLSVIGTESRSSVSMVTWPAYLGSNRSQIESTPGARSVRTIRPVMPLCLGTVKSRFGSAAGWRSEGSRLASTLGSAVLSSL
jgi:hypothetical protein